jgi:adenylate kinase family enzyme
LNKIHRATPERTDAIRIDRAIAEAARRGVQIRLIVGATDDCLPAAIELSRIANTEVRFDPSLAFADVNYLSADESTLVVGIRKVLPDPHAYEVSKEWYHILSSTMVSAMNSVFIQRWDAPSTSTLEQMLRRSIPRIVSGNGRESVSRQLGLSLAEVDYYTQSGPFIVVLMGRPGSGKTTVARSVVSSLSNAGISAVHYSDFEWFSKLFLTAGNDKFERTLDGGFYVTDKSQFENATNYLADCVEKSGREITLVVLEMAREKYAEALRILKDRGVSIDLAVYIDVDYETAALRNTWRKQVDGGHFVSEKEMQTTFATDDARDIERRLGPLFFKLQNPDTRHDDQKVMAGRVLSQFRTALATKWLNHK